jgi:hypothetical protein
MKEEEDFIDCCVLCGEPTIYTKSDNINIRYWYVEGAGQLCVECYNKTFKEK